MKPRTCWVALLLGALIGAGPPVPAPLTPLVPAPPVLCRAPLLFVRFIGPPGMRVTCYQGPARPRSFDAPVAIGMRPGYIHRVQLSHLPQQPAISIYPSLEVRNTLSVSPKLSASAYPAPVVLTEADIASIVAGNLITKVVYLEDPDRALPVPSQPGRPVVELPLPPDRDLEAEARDRGRPMLVVRMGGRILVSEEELAHQTVFGTLLLPGERSLMPPAAPPCVLIDPRPFFDPFLGPRPPSEECLHDGGDQGRPVGFDRDGSLLGVDPEDTVAEWTDCYGRRRLTCSNRVCLCVPRYGVLVKETPLGRAEGLVLLNDIRRVLGEQQLQSRLPSLLAQQNEELLGMQGRVRPTVNVGEMGTFTITRVEVLQPMNMVIGPAAILGTHAMELLTEVQRTLLKQQIEFARELSVINSLRVEKEVIGTAVVGRVEAGPQVVRATAETRDLTVCCNEAPCPPDKPLVLVKCADRHTAQPGDVVTFTLRYSNHGGQPITDVAVTDSLAARLEYVPDSSQSDRPAVFTLQQNEAGSLLLRWEITGRLLPGQSGVVRFQARIR
jgi:uncharacterized repeat protein (TIGR01451 family)